jgi:hypothetical protein
MRGHLPRTRHRTARKQYNGTVLHHLACIKTPEETTIKEYRLLRSLNNTTQVWTYCKGWPLRGFWATQSFRDMGTWTPAVGVYVAWPWRVAMTVPPSIKKGHVHANVWFSDEVRRW